MSAPPSPLGSAAGFCDVLARLAATIDLRAFEGDATGSWTARLLASGPAACAAKLTEEAGEAALAVTSEDEGRLASEAADVLYHLLVAMRSRGVGLDAVADVLKSREGRSGVAEKASRKTT